MSPGERVFVGLGANLGDARATLAQALAELAALPQTKVVGSSSVWLSAPVDAQGPDFFNAVAEIDTALEPEPLLSALQGIEQRHGRERPYRHAPRSLDLDLLLYGSRVLATPALTLPHPRLHERAFVLRPLAELAPALVHPTQGAISALIARTFDQPIRKLP